MGKPRHYGTSRRNVTASASSIFGTESFAANGSSATTATLTSRTRQVPSKALEDWGSVTQSINDVAKDTGKSELNIKHGTTETTDDSTESSESIQSVSESPSESEELDDVEDQEDQEDSDDEDEAEANKSQPLKEDSIISDFQHSAADHSSFGQPAPSHLHPLAHAYLTDRNAPLLISTWPQVIPPSSTISKIAEASYAEVYRITTPHGTSILKVLQLRIPTDPLSLEIETAIDASDLVAEIRIMNVLAEVPGFVGFKDAHLIQGRFAPALEEAYWEFLENREGEEEKESFFPDPGVFTDESTFLVLELADAGTVLEDCEVSSVDQVWDLWLGVVMALSRAEVMCEFEHRDLHENNICVRQKHSPPKHNPSHDGALRYGFSGYAITIIDYGLSRAKVENGDIVFQDLEKDLELYHGESGGSHGMQFDNYRRMRNHLFTGLRSMERAEWHDEASRELSNAHTWEEHIPYTNVLWIRYILSYLTKQFRKSKAKGWKDSLARFEAEMKEIKRRLDVRTKVENGAFSSAMEILDFVFQQGWVDEEMLEGFGMDSTILSQ